MEKLSSVHELLRLETDEVSLTFNEINYTLNLKEIRASQPSVAEIEDDLAKLLSGDSEFDTFASFN